MAVCIIGVPYDIIIISFTFAAQKVDLSDFDWYRDSNTAALINICRWGMEIIRRWVPEKNGPLLEKDNCFMKLSEFGKEFNQFFFLGV